MRNCLGNGWYLTDQVKQKLNYDMEEYTRLTIESERWLRRHKLGGSVHLSTGHVFETWYDEYFDEHPEWFAVQLDGSGALDDLAWCAPSLPRALAVERNGSGTNTLRLTSLSLPVLGSTWNADLDCSALGNGLATLDVRRLPLSGRPTLYGELLIGGALAHRSSGPFAGSARTLGWSIPNDMALCGLDFHAQGLCTSTSFGRGKTLRMRAGLSNAIDLVLGF